MPIIRSTARLNSTVMCRTVSPYLKIGVGILSQTSVRVTRRNLTKDLMRWGKRAVRALEDGGAHFEHVRLLETLQQVMMHDSDSPIHEAVRRLRAEDEENAADLIGVFADETASTVLVAEGMATAILVPVVVDSSTAIHQPELEVAIQEMVAGLHGQGLIDQSQVVRLCPVLFDMESLRVGWCRRHQWARDLAEGNPEEAGALPLHMSRSRGGSVVSGPIVRFIAGVVIDPGSAEEDDAMPLNDWADLEDDPDMAPRVEAWEHDAATALSHVIDAGFVAVGLPGRWQDGMERGVAMLNVVRLEWYLSAASVASDDACTSPKMSRGYGRVRLEWQGGPPEGGWVIRLDDRDNDSGALWSVTGGRHEDMEFLLDTLWRHGIVHMEVSENARIE